MAVGRGARPGSDIVRISLQIKIKFLQLDKVSFFLTMGYLYNLRHSVREDRMVFPENIRKHYLRPYMKTFLLYHDTLINVL